MAAIYSNENFPLPAVQELRRLGHDVLTIQETGEAGNALPDDAVLAVAAGQGRILLNPASPALHSTASDKLAAQRNHRLHL